MLNILFKIEKYVIKMVNAILISSFSVITIIVVYSVFSRNILGYSAYWTDEAARYLLIFVGYLGASISLQRGDLIGIKGLLNKLPIKISNYIMFFSRLLITVFCISIFTSSLAMVKEMYVMEHRSAQLLIPMWIPYSIIPLGLLLLSFFSFVSLFRIITDSRTY